MSTKMKSERWLPALVLVLALLPACWGLSMTVLKQECVSEEVHHPGDKVSVYFAVQDYELFWGTEHPGIDLEVTTDTGIHVYEDKGKAEHEFDFRAPKKGIYKFCFKNPTSVPEFVSFYIHVGHVPHKAEVAEDEHFNPLDEKIAELRETLEQIFAEQKYLGVRNTRHHKTNMSTQRRLLFYTLAEYLVLASASALQVFLIRRLFSRRIGYNTF